MGMGDDEGRDWLDGWMPRSVPGSRWVWRSRHSSDVIKVAPEPPAPTPPSIISMADTMYILRHGKKAWREMRRGQRL